MDEGLLEKLNRFPIVLIAIAYAAFLGWDYYEFETSPGSELSTTREQVKALRAQIKMKDKRIKEGEKFFQTLEAKRAEIRQLAQQLADMKTTLSEELDVSAVIRLVTTEAQKTGLMVQSIRPGKERKEEFYFEQTFNFDFRGVFAQLLVFLDRVSSLQKIIKVDDFDIKPLSSKSSGPTLLTGKLRIKAYRYSGSKADEIANSAQNPTEGS